MKPLGSALFLFFATCIQFHGAHSFPDASENFPYKQIISEERYQLFWKFDETHITFEVHAATKGWVGFGLSPNGGMANSDIVMGWVMESGTSFSDRHALGEFEPKVDDEQNWELLSSSESDGFTVLKFKRQIVTCDERDNDVQKSDLTYVIWAIGESDPDGDTGAKKHLYKGVQSLYLMDPPRPPPNDGDDVKYFLFSALDYNVTTKKTDWYHTYYEIPGLDEKHHVIRFEPYLQEDNKDILHHMALYICSEPVVNKTTISLSIPKNDTRENVFSMKKIPCTAVIFAWALGGGDFTLPEDAGFAIGGDDYRYFSIEVHYNNPDHFAGRVDSSGIRIAYTSKLRPHDMGTLIVMNEPSTNIIVPPREPDVVAWGRCNPDCLSDSLAGRTINVFSILSHTHTLGMKVKLRIERDGAELETILKDDNYNWQYQRSRLLHNIRKIKPGDQLTYECHYNSIHMSRPVIGGLDSDEEMCAVLIHYYPRISLDRCSSFSTYGADMASAIEKGNQIRESYDWDKADVREDFHELLLKSDNVYYCSNVSGLYEKGMMGPITIPKPYDEPPGKTCSGVTVSVHRFTVIIAILSVIWSLFCRLDDDL